MWYDERISKYVNSSVSLQRDEIKSLWFPDTFCYNAKKSDLMLPDTEVHSVIRIDPDGLVFYSRRLVLPYQTFLVIFKKGFKVTSFPRFSAICRVGENPVYIMYKKVEMNSGLIICLEFKMHVLRYYFAYKNSVHTKFNTEEELRVYVTRLESHDFPSSVHSVSNQWANETIDVGAKSIVKLYVRMNSPLTIRKKTGPS